MSYVADYVLLDDFHTTGGGRCQWTFATKDGVDYFIKRFLAPKRVVPGGPGGPATIRARLARCEAFEARQNRLLATLAGKTGKGGNLIAPVEFFSYDGSYYKVTEKIESKGLSPASISALPLANQQMIIRSAANSVRILHSCRIVHGDLKKDNIIIRTRTGGTTTASIIDFDDSYFEGEPPLPPEEFTFDPSYAAPEVYRFIADPSPAHAAKLMAAADIYSLGIVFCEYLSGEKPKVIGGHSRYTGEVLLKGGRLSVPDLGAWNGFKPVLQSMLARDPATRPNLKEVLDQLKTGSKPHARAGAPTPPPIVIKLGPRSGSERKDDKPTGTKPITLRGTLAPKDRA
jgi:serine/threonine protein kinase